MGNINTYLNWRGDLDFTERPFCEADNLALAIFSYLDLGQIIPPDQGEISMKEAYEKYQALGITHFSGDEFYRLMFQLMAASRRFGTAMLSNYRTKFNEIQATQFAAVSIALGDGSRYLSFRGTDNSITGWEEDFRMGSEVVPAQREAVRYLNEVMKPGERCRIGGHSKGGNLAIYSSVHCKEELANSIIAVYNNDGPGLSSDIIPVECCQRIRERLCWIIPEFSVIGTLFPYGPPTKIVGSTGDGLLQHDPFTWQIEGDAFLEKEALCQPCRFYVGLFDTWINSADLEHRQAFTRDFFGALRAGGAKTIGDVLGGGLDGFGTVLLSIVNSESRTKIVIGKLLQSFLTRLRSIDLRAAIRTKRALKGSLLLIGGILLMLFPGAALHLVGMFAGGTAIFLLGKRILSYAGMEGMDTRQKKFRIISCLACIIAVEFLVVNKNAILISSHFILGVLLLLFAFRTIYQMAKIPHSLLERFFMCVSVVLAVMLGIVAFTKTGQGSEKFAINS